MTKVTYEWCAEERDEHGDIHNLNHADRLEQLRSFKNQDRTQIVLIRDIHLRDTGELLHRAWAYIENGKLRDVFDTCGMPPPKRFHKEVDRFFKSVV